MLEALKREWRAFRSQRAGTRFQRIHRRRAGQPSSRLWRAAVMLAGSVLIVIGLVMILLPGPGLLTMLAGVALIAGESLTVARLFDRANLALERRWARVRRT